jgi:FAD/FMN-containing dehydrogenase
MLDATAPHGWRFYDRLHYLPAVGDELIDALVEEFERVPTPQSHVMTAWMGGAVDDAAAGETAFGHRDSRALTWLIGCSGDDPIEPAAEWVRGAWERTAGFASGGVYVNALEEGRSPRDAYAEGIWARLVEIKRRYDPDGVFPGNGIG